MKTHTMRNDAAAQLESQRAIESVHLKTRGLLRLASDARERHEKAVMRLAAVQDDAPVLAGSDSGRRAVAAVLPPVLGAIFVVEWLLAAPTAEWFAISLLGSPSWTPTLTWLLPTSVFLLEVLIAVQISEEAERRRDGQGTLRPLLLGILLFLVMPLFSLATQLAIVPEEPELFWMFTARTAGLVLLAAVLHGTVLASGRLIRESLGWWGFTLSCASWRARAWWLQRKARRASNAALDTFTIYRRLFSRHRQAWPADVLEFGPWDRSARTILGDDLDRTSPPSTLHVDADQGRIGAPPALTAIVPGANGSSVGHA